MEPVQDVGAAPPQKAGLKPARVTARAAKAGAVPKDPPPKVSHLAGRLLAALSPPANRKRSGIINGTIETAKATGVRNRTVAAVRRAVVAHPMDIKTRAVVANAEIRASTKIEGPETKIVRMKVETVATKAKTAATRADRVRGAEIRIAGGISLNADNPKAANGINVTTGKARVGRAKVAVVEARSGIDRTLAVNHVKMETDKDSDVEITTREIKGAPQIVPAMKSIRKGMTGPTEVVRTTNAVTPVAVTRGVAVPTMITNAQASLEAATRNEAERKNAATKAKDALTKAMNATRVHGAERTNIIRAVKDRAEDRAVRGNRGNWLAQPEVEAPNGKALAVDNNRHSGRPLDGNV